MERLADSEAVRRHVRRICFKTGPPRRVGAELEWLVADPHRPYDPVPLDPLMTAVAAAGPPPHGSSVTYEPGGQLELSSPPADGPTACRRLVEADRDHVAAALRPLGVTLLPTAVDPWRSPARQLYAPRYDAMERYFDRLGPVGRQMMCCTASVQVNVDAGADDADVRRRWDLLHVLGPALVATFANSPVQAGEVTGWKSSRQRVWQRLDPGRTAMLRPTGGATGGGTSGGTSGATGDGTGDGTGTGDLAAAWAEYALDAGVMARRDGAGWCGDGGDAYRHATFREWVEGACAGVPPPTEADLAYHLTTLFPPVRPRGFLEVRYLDLPPHAWWAVPMAVLCGLLDDASAGAAARTACDPVSGLRTGSWTDAARAGPADPRLAAAGLTCLRLAADALRRRPGEHELAALVDAYAERYPARGRCPADDHLDDPSVLLPSSAPGAGTAAKEPA